jgi:hypothetical protein
LLNGLYKVRVWRERRVRPQHHVHAQWQAAGRNSAFAHLGTYQENGGEIIGEVITQRHNDDPYYKPLMDTDVAAISVRGKLQGNRIRFEGNAARRGPGACSGPS